MERGDKPAPRKPVIGASIHERVRSSYIGQNENQVEYDESHIKALQDDRMQMQRKTFTNWINSIFIQAQSKERVDDMFLDLRDGRKLIRLLELISEEKIFKPNPPKMRLLMVENVNYALVFIRKHQIHAKGIGAEDIVDGNKPLTLGLIWMIILRFTIQDIILEEEDEEEIRYQQGYQSLDQGQVQQGQDKEKEKRPKEKKKENKSVKEALIEWGKNEISEISDKSTVQVNDFTTSWKDGTAFLAVLHHIRPDLVDLDTLNPETPIENLNRAFNLAADELGIPKLLDAEDVCREHPDEKSIMTYVGSLYRYIAKKEKERKGKRQLGNIIRELIIIDGLKDKYRRLMDELFKWILEKIAELSKRDFPNTVDGVQKDLFEFKKYINKEKPCKYKEKMEIEATLFSIQTRLNELGHGIYVPPEGYELGALDQSWDNLEKCENDREKALRDELYRNERLEILASRFRRKGYLREKFMQEIVQVMKDPKYLETDVEKVEAALTKHHTVTTEVQIQEEKINELCQLSEELYREDYHDKEQISRKEGEILEEWKELCSLLKERETVLEKYVFVARLLRDIVTITEKVKDMQEDIPNSFILSGFDVTDLEDLLERQTLLESEITSMEEVIECLTKRAGELGHIEKADEQKLHHVLRELKREYEELKGKSKKRHDDLVAAVHYLDFVEQYNNEFTWILEKKNYFLTPISYADVNSVHNALVKQKMLEDEMNARRLRCHELLRLGKDLLKTHQGADDEIIETRRNNLRKEWVCLEDLAVIRRQMVEDLIEVFQFYFDASELETWIREMKVVVSSQDIGDGDENVTHALLQRHLKLENEITDRASDVKKLDEEGNRLIDCGIASAAVRGRNRQESTGDDIREVVLEPVEIEIIEIVQVEKREEIVEEIEVKLIQMLYKFDEKGVYAAKDEILKLLNATNDEWWEVRKFDDSETGFVPATYVRKIEPTFIRKKIPRVVKVPEKRKVKKTVMKEKVVKRKKERRIESSSSEDDEGSDHSEEVEKLQHKVNVDYEDLLSLATNRRWRLQNAYDMFRFNIDSEEFESWMKNKEEELQEGEGKIDDENFELLIRELMMLETDLTFRTKLFNELDNLANDLIGRQHPGSEEIKGKQKDIKEKWDSLHNDILERKNELENLTSLERFTTNEEELEAYFNVFIDKLDKAKPDQTDSGSASAPAAFKRPAKDELDYLEKSIDLLEKRVKDINAIGDLAKVQSPETIEEIEQKQKHLNDLMEETKDKAVSDLDTLKTLVEINNFFERCTYLVMWLNTTNQALETVKQIHDVITVEVLIKEHEELGTEIKYWQEEFLTLDISGQELYRKYPNQETIPERLELLKNGNEEVRKAWTIKGELLLEYLSFQMFNKETNQMKSVLNGYLRFLNIDRLGGNIGAVAALLLRHHDFVKTLDLQEAKLSAYSEHADKLINAEHHRRLDIDDMRNEVLNHYEAIKGKAQKRKELLLQSMTYHEFKNEAEYLIIWINQKKQQIFVDDLDFSDIIRIKGKMLKQLKLEYEINPGEETYESLIMKGEDLLASDHYAKSNIRFILDQIIKDWEDLCSKAAEQGIKLREGERLFSYVLSLRKIVAKLNGIEKELSQAVDSGNVTASRKLWTRHQMIQNELNAVEMALIEAIAVGNELASESMFDWKQIFVKAEELLKRCRDMIAEAEIKRKRLDDLLHFHEFRFQVIAELQWVREHEPIASSTFVGLNLVDATNLFNKHKTLVGEIRAHQPIIDRTMEQGKTLLDRSHHESKLISELCEQLMKEWLSLILMADQRGVVLDLSYKILQFNSDVNEGHLSINEVSELLNNPDCGKDVEGTQRLIDKHQLILYSVDSCNYHLKELFEFTDNLLESKHPDQEDMLINKNILKERLDEVLRRSESRTRRLADTKERHELADLCEELEAWVRSIIDNVRNKKYPENREESVLFMDEFERFQTGFERQSVKMNLAEEAVGKMMDEKSAFVWEIEIIIDPLRKLWAELLELVDERATKLKMITDVINFEWDVAMILEDIQEKKDSIPSDIGRDVPIILLQQRAFIRLKSDMDTMRIEEQKLITTGDGLGEMYPDNPNFPESVDRVARAWNELEEKCNQRGEKLESAMLFCKLAAKVRDFVTWAKETQRMMGTHDYVHDTQSVELLLMQHECTRNEILSRQEQMTFLSQEGRAMISNYHFANEKISEMLNQLLESWKETDDHWLKKQSYLDRLMDFCVFFRDAKKLDAICSVQEGYLASMEISSDVYDIEKQLKKLEKFHTAVLSQDEREAALHVLAEKLNTYHNFDAKLALEDISKLSERRRGIKELCEELRRKLEDSFLYQQLKNNIEEILFWIEEKLQKIEKQRFSEEFFAVEDKVAWIHKEHSFQAEVVANEGRVTEIECSAQVLLSRNHESSDEIRTLLEVIRERWNRLLLIFEERIKALENAQQILDFLTKVQILEVWIREKVVFVNSFCRGNDYEHCEFLMRKLGELEKGIENHVPDLNEINELAARLAHPEINFSLIEQRKEEVNVEFQALSDNIKKYRIILEEALEIHLFDREVMETLQRIGTKEVELSMEETISKNLDGIEDQMKKLQRLRSDVNIIEDKVKQLDGVGSELSEKYPNESEGIGEKLRRLHSALDELKKRLEKIHTDIENEFPLCKFYEEARKLETWANRMLSEFYGHLGQNLAEAEMMIDLHQEKKVEIEGRRPMFRLLKELGTKLIKANHRDSEEIKTCLVRLKELRHNLGASWNDRDVKLKQCLELHIFLKEENQLNSWLAKKEKFLDEENFGNSLASVLALIKLFASFERALEVKKDRVKDVRLRAAQLVASQHYDSDRIEREADLLKENWQLVKTKTKNRKKLLEEAKEFRLFVELVFEVRDWINSKRKVAGDRSYMDLEGLQTKIRKHREFEAEVLANRQRMDDVAKEEKRLVESINYASAEISQKMSDLEALWNQLLDEINTKKRKLIDADNAVKFFQKLDDIEASMDKMERILRDDDVGSDFSSVNLLFEKLQLVHMNVSSLQETIETIKQEVNHFCNTYHFLLETIQKRADQTIQRFMMLEKLAEIRKQLLDRSMLVFHLIRDIDLHLSWIDEKELVLEATKIGSTFTKAERSLKDHKVFEEEVYNHEPMVTALLTKAQEMMNKSQENLHGVLSKQKELEHKFARLKILLGEKKEKILDYIELLSYFNEVGNVEMWIREKKPLLTSQFLDDEEDDIMVHLSTLEDVVLEIDNYFETIKKLRLYVTRLIERKRHNEELINQKQADIENQYQDLKDMTVQRRCYLNDCLKLYNFVREADDVIRFINQRLMTADSRNYGTDIAHVEQLIEQFETFLGELKETEDLVQLVQGNANTLVNGGHPEPERIQHKVNQMLQFWDDLQDAIKRREEGLQVAKEIGKYNYLVEQTLSWIEEKLIILKTEAFERESNNLAELTKKYDDLERSLGAVEGNVEMIIAEAERLSAIFLAHARDIKQNREDVELVWKALIVNLKRRKELFSETQKIHDFVSSFNELIDNMGNAMADVTAPELASDIEGTEELLQSHNDLRAEIDEQIAAFNRFRETGEKIQEDDIDHAEDIDKKIEEAEMALKQLEDTWLKRKELYEQCLDLQMFNREADQMEAWVDNRNSSVQNEPIGDSIEEIEELIKKQDDLERIIDIQEEKLNALQRPTLFELEEEKKEHEKFEDAPVTVETEVVEEEVLVNDDSTTEALVENVPEYVPERLVEPEIIEKNIRESGADFESANSASSSSDSEDEFLSS